MNLNPAHLWAEMGVINKMVTLSLAVMLIWSVAVFVERLLAFSRSTRESRAFAQQAAPLMDEWNLEALGALADRHSASALARLFGAMVKRYDAAVEGLAEGLTPVELARNEGERRKEQIGADLRRGMSTLATFGSIAPFVGLLGTVMGIITAFQGISSAGGGLQAVSGGIAEALIETAIGLMVAIPAVLFYNYLSGRIATIELALGRSAGELLDEMENRYGRVTGTRAKQAA
ncbi:MAG: MotA/TolQ/ExbB proton channel family protein [Polyangiaceae bacterium]|nr:MotA/TolQ/ExbB proton channel family protein [Polyangiaceae bacterium]